jgi:hypothetical protein
MMPAISLSPVVKPVVWTVTVTQSASSQAVILTVLLLALIAKVVLQGVVRSPHRNAFPVLNAIIVPLLAAFLIIVLLRFRNLSY